MSAMQPLEVLRVSPEKLFFKNVVVNQTSVQTVSITNTLNSAVTFRIKPSADKYEVVPDNVKLGAGEERSIQVRLRVTKHVDSKKQTGVFKDTFMIKSEYFEQKFVAKYQLAPPGAAHENKEGSLRPKRSAPTPTPRHMGTSVTWKEGVVSASDSDHTLAQREIESLKAHIATQQEQLEEERGIVATGRNRIDALESEVQELRATIASSDAASLKIELLSCQDQKQQLEKKFQDKAAECELLAKEVNHLQGLNKQLCATMPDLPKIVAKMTTHDNEDREQRDAKVLELLKKRDEKIKALEDQVLDLDTQRLAAVAKFEDSRRQLAVAEADIENAVAAKHDAQREAAEAAEKAIMIERLVTPDINNVQALEAALVEARSFAEETNKIRSDLEQRLVAAMARCEEAEDLAASESQHGVDRLRGALEELSLCKAQRDEKATRVRELESTCESQGEQLEAMMLELSGRGGASGGRAALSRSDNNNMSSNAASDAAMLRQRVNELEATVADGERVFAEQLNSFRRNVENSVSGSGRGDGGELATVRARVFELEEMNARQTAALRMAERESTRSASSALRQRDAEIESLRTELSQVRRALAKSEGLNDDNNEPSKGGTGPRSSSAPRGGNRRLGNKHTDELGTLRGQLDRAEIEVAALKQSVSRHRATEDRLRTRLAALEEIQTGSQATMLEGERKLERALAQTIEVNHENKENPSANAAVVNKLNAKITNLQTECDDLKRKLADKASLNGRTGTGGRPGRKLSDKDKALEEKTAKIASLERALFEAKKRAQAYHDKIVTEAIGSSDKDSSDGPSSSQRAEMQRLYSTVEAQELALEDARAQTVALSSELETSKRLHSEEIWNLGQATARAQHELKVARNDKTIKMAQLEQQVKQLSNKSDLASKLAGAGAEVAALRVSEARNVAEMQFLRDQVKSLNGQLAERSSRLQALEDQLRSTHGNSAIANKSGSAARPGGHAETQKQAVANSALSARVREQAAEIRRLESLLRAAKIEFDKRQNRESDAVTQAQERVRGAETYAGVHEERVIELQREALALEDALAAANVQIDSAQAEASRARTRAEAAEGLVGELTDTLGEVRASAAEARGLHERAMYELECKGLKERQDAATLTAELQRRVQEGAARAAAAEATTKELRGNVEASKERAAASETEKHRVITEANESIQALRREAEASKTLLERANVTVRERSEQVAVLNESIAALQGGDDEREQRLVALATRLNNAIAVEAELQRQIIKANADREDARESAAAAVARESSARSDAATARADAVKARLECDVQVREVASLRASLVSKAEEFDVVTHACDATTARLRRSESEGNALRDLVATTKRRHADALQQEKQQARQQAEAARDACANQRCSGAAKDLTSPGLHLAAAMGHVAAQFERLANEEEKRLPRPIVTTWRTSTGNNAGNDSLSPTAATSTPKDAERANSRRVLDALIRLLAEADAELCKEWRSRRAAEAALSASSSEVRSLIDLVEELATAKTAAECRWVESQKYLHGRGLLGESQAGARVNALESRIAVLSEELQATTACSINHESNAVSLQQENERLNDALSTLQRTHDGCVAESRSACAIAAETATVTCQQALEDREEILRVYMKETIVSLLGDGEASEVALNLTRELCGQKLAERKLLESNNALRTQLSVVKEQAMAMQSRSQRLEEALLMRPLPGSLKEDANISELRGKAQTLDEELWQAKAQSQLHSQACERFKIQIGELTELNEELQRREAAAIAEGAARVDSARAFNEEQREQESKMAEARVQAASHAYEYAIGELQATVVDLRAELERAVGVDGSAQTEECGPGTAEQESTITMLQAHIVEMEAERKSAIERATEAEGQLATAQSKSTAKDEALHALEDLLSVAASKEQRPRGGSSRSVAVFPNNPAAVTMSKSLVKTRVDLAEALQRAKTAEASVRSLRSKLADKEAALVSALGHIDRTAQYDGEGSGSGAGGSRGRSLPASPAKSRSSEPRMASASPTRGRKVAWGVNQPQAKPQVSARLSSLSHDQALKHVRDLESALSRCEDELQASRNGEAATQKALQELATTRSMVIDESGEHLGSLASAVASLTAQLQEKEALVTQLAERACNAEDALSSVPSVSSDMRVTEGVHGRGSSIGGWWWWWWWRWQ